MKITEYVEVLIYNFQTGIANRSILVKKHCFIVCVCVFGFLQTCIWFFTDVYQSDMIIYVWGPTFNVTTSPSERRDSVSNLRPRLNQFVTSTVSWITGARHNA